MLVYYLTYLGKANDFLRGKCPFPSNCAFSINKVISSDTVVLFFKITREVSKCQISVILRLDNISESSYDIKLSLVATKDFSK